MLLNCVGYNQFILSSWIQWSGGIRKCLLNCTELCKESRGCATKVQSQTSLVSTAELGLAYLCPVWCFAFSLFIIIMFCSSLIVSGYQILHKRKKRGIKSHLAILCGSVYHPPGTHCAGRYREDRRVKETAVPQLTYLGLAFPWCCGSGGLRRV